MAKRRSHKLPSDLEAVLTHALSVRQKRHSTPPRVYRLHISLLEIEPLIWRRVQVPANISLRRLHDVFQIAMGWTDSHLHEFTIGDVHFGMTEPEAEPPATLRDDRLVTLGEVASIVGGEFAYDYDFGDDWNHRVVIESVDNAGAAAARALCLDGARACPPEDCGGTSGYDHMLQVVNDPSHEEHDEIFGWLGGEFDPEAFDLDEVNTALCQLRLSTGRRTATVRRKAR